MSGSESLYSVLLIAIGSSTGRQRGIFKAVISIIAKIAIIGAGNGVWDVTVGFRRGKHLANRSRRVSQRGLGRQCLVTPSK